MQRIQVFFIALILSQFVAVVSPVTAGFGQGLAISPPSHIINVAPGEEYEVVTKLINAGDSDVNLSLRQGAMELDQFNVITLSDPEQAQLQNWLELPAEAILLPADSSQDLIIKITPPPGTQPGTYFPTVVAQQTGFAGDEDSSAIINLDLIQIIGVNVATEFPPEIIEISELKINNPVVSGEVRISYGLTNLSTFYTRPTGRIQLVSPSGKRVWEEIVNPDETGLAAGSGVSKSIILSEGEDIELSEIGEYKLELLVLDDQFETAGFKSSQSFIVPSLYILLAGVFLILLLLIALGVVLRVISRRANKEQSLEYK